MDGNVAFLALAGPELAGVADRHSEFMAAVRALAGNGEFEFAVEFEFLGDDFVVFLACLAGENFVYDGVGSVLEIVGEGDRFFFEVSHASRRPFGPPQHDIIFVFPAVAVSEGGFFIYREIVISAGFVIGEAGEFGWEELSPFFGFFHVFDNFFAERDVFFR